MFSLCCVLLRRFLDDDEGLELLPWFLGMLEFVIGAVWGCYAPTATGTVAVDVATTGYRLYLLLKLLLDPYF